ncbi:MAG: hypothetical protein J07HN4v3_02367 [Halonotius sp. J07HN4]|nr:MAG: hypothetical protein J07HN4v3_02367 [Halonotius sp. J07HN4]
MAAIRSLQPALGRLVGNPIIILVAAVYGLLQLPQLLVPITRPLLSTAVSLLMSGLIILFLPFYQGGILGMADDARTGSTTLNEFIQAGKSNYISLLVAYFVVLAIATVFGVTVLIGTLVGGIGVVAGNGQPSTAILAVLAAVGLLIVGAYLAIITAIQFYGHEIVLNDASIVDGFTRSLGLVRENTLSVIGHSLLLFVGGGVGGGLAAAASMLMSPQPPLESMLPEISLPIVIGAAILSVLAVGLLGAFYATYSVTFYRELTESSRARM